MRAERIIAGGLRGVPVVLAGGLATALLPSPAMAAPGRPMLRQSVARPVVTGRSPAVRPTSYRVAAGDTVSGIAARFGLSTGTVLAWNGLHASDIIYPGQTIRLTAPAPAVARRPASHVVRRGETATGIARRMGVSTAALLRANGLTWSSLIYPGQVLHAPAQPTSLHTVAAAGEVTVHTGDTLWGIAARHHVSLVALLDDNGLTEASVIQPGQRVRLPGSTQVPGLSPVQSADAAAIVREGHALGVPPRGIAIALGTAMQESGLRNLDYGDRDSAGLFQQRPSYGWGTPAQVRDIDYAIHAFFEGGPLLPDGTRAQGLLDIPGWQRLSFAAAAQAVQNSADPTLYAQWEGPAEGWLAALGG